MSAFAFKQFSLFHESSSMKIGTDAVLLGAYIQLQNEKRVFEVGCGCGVISFMMAQTAKDFPNIEFLSIDIDPLSVEEAILNLNFFPFPTKLSFINISLQEFFNSKQEEFDLIVSNPPFFVNSLKSKNPARSKARHTETLTFEDLAKAASVLMKKEGRMVVIIDNLSFLMFEHAMKNENLFVFKILQIYTNDEVEPSRLILEISKNSKLKLETSKIHIPSEKYTQLTQKFYL